ncbi:MAG: deoxyribodipyrimidine photo-lyase, partial [Rhodomicrobium sp.]|nr:deoxyribodipyrimidine photo-lyase [Rhodomicrobium sp.]
MRSKSRSADESVALLWFRRDLRLADHPALTAAVEAGTRIIPVYILDDETPGVWRAGGASRWWLAQSLRSLDKSLRGLGSRLILRRGNAEKVLTTLIVETDARAVYWTRGYEPFQRQLEERLKTALPAAGAECRRFGGQILFEPERHLNRLGEVFRVFSPFYKTLLAQGKLRPPHAAPSRLPLPAQWPQSDVLESWELEPAKPDWADGLRTAWAAGEAPAQTRLTHFIEKLMQNYARRRNQPGIDGTSRLSPYLALGEISPRQIWHAVLTAAEAAGKPGLGEDYLRQIAWREF